MKTTEQRINNVIGQLNGINKMLKHEKDCMVVINQLKAVKAAVSSLMEVVIEDEFHSCLKKGGEYNKQTMKKIFVEIIKK